MELIDLLRETVERHGSDLFFVPGASATAKVKGEFIPLTEQRPFPQDTEELVHEAYRLANREETAL